MRHFNIPDELDWRLMIRKPTADRHEFRVIKRWGVPINQKRTVKDARIDRINRYYTNGEMDDKLAIKELELVIEQLYRAAGVKVIRNVANLSNIDRLNKFWDVEYASRDLVDRESLYNDYRRAVEALGEVSLVSSTSEQINAALDRSCEGRPNVRRRVVQRLKTILKHLKVDDVRMRTAKPVRKSPAHLSLEDFKEVLQFVEKRKLRLFMEVAFYSGCRQGEVLAFEEHHWRDGGQLWVEAQLDRSDNIRDIKTRDSHLTAFIGPKKVFMDWIKVKGDINKHDRHKVSSVLKAACRDAFPMEPKKWITFHDLRHSFAIELARAGVSIGHIAGCLGNSEMVCERYYKGFGATDDSIQIIHSKLKERKDEL